MKEKEKNKSEYLGTLFDNEDMYFFKPKLESEQMLLDDQKKSSEDQVLTAAGNEEPIDYTVGKANDIRQAEKKKISKGWYVAIAGTVVLGMTTFGMSYYLDSAKGDKDATEDGKIYMSIPDVTGLTKSEAEQYLKLYNIKLTEKNTEYSDEYKKDYIISQSPKSGKDASGISDISVVISLGYENVTVPDLSGKTKKEAITTLKKADLKYNFEKKYSDTVEKDRVISQKEAANSSITKYSTVTVYISDGKDPNKVTTTAPVTTAATEAQTEAPQPQTAAPQPQTAAPQPQTAAPQPQTAAPQPQTAAPQPQTEAPQPQTEAPQPQTAAPETTAAGSWGDLDDVGDGWGDLDDGADGWGDLGQ